jgi:hypothetical protein
MRNNDLTDNPAVQPIKKGPRQQAWWTEEIKFEIERLKEVLRDPFASDEEKAIAQSQVANYRELSAKSASPSWLQQMDCLADEPASRVRALRRSA